MSPDYAWMLKEFEIIAFQTPDALYEQLTFP